MIKKYLKIFSLSARSNISVTLLIKSILEYVLYFVVINFVLGNVRYFSGYSSYELNIISGVYVLLFLSYRFLYKNALIFRYLVVTRNFDLVLLKPVNSVFKLLTNKIDFEDLVVGTLLFLTLIYFAPFPYVVLVISGIAISLTIFITTISLLLITSGELPMENFLLTLFLIGFLGLVNMMGALVSILLALLLLFLSIQLWNYALTKYTNASN